MVLLIDNYDSFSYNLYQYIGEFNPDIKVIRNDELKVSDIERLRPSHIVISPGPGKPKDAGICIELIKELHESFPILGICLGHQAIFEAFGGVVSYASGLMHGRSSKVMLSTANPLFTGLPVIIEAARYHSLMAYKDTLPSELKITARTEDGEIMAVCHKDRPVYGVQFHPESVLTPKGKLIVGNFLQQ